ncbi:TRM11 family SAM-dependent methyltransferase [Paenibacillus bouchesdurhonensis]|uniref:TRM11 family SAM-dependent methyltransferase n=1 Tax=Paenibacillus bouchesdurhonensis TaxID=1870990 RepID=UPI000DA63BFB|nr:methyltransferase domain-containing protein [Paenibacillus bouchesdurhonensis]
MCEQGIGQYIYTYACHDNERRLCEMELNALFGQRPGSVGYVETQRRIDPGRSPFISYRMDVLFTGESLESIAAQAAGLQLNDRTFKVIYLKQGDVRGYEEQRDIERQVGSRIHGKAEMRRPEVTYGLMSINGHWSLGICHEAEPVWLHHKHKPRNYSTGLSTLVARALVNIAVPDPHAMKVIDPCCGMGNAMIEALSMEIDIVGRDINPLAVRGARVNLRHFGYDDSRVSLGDLNEVDELYDAAIVDMPYNLCSVLPSEERRQMLSSIERFSRRAVIVSTEQLEEELNRSGLAIHDYGTVSKSSFIRHIWLCEPRRRV